MIPIPIWAIPAALAATLMLSGATGFMGYQHGVSVQEAKQTKEELKQSRKDFDDFQKNANKADAASGKFEAAKPVIVHDVKTRTEYVNIPPDADPLMPVWFERMLDRLSSGDARFDASPGEPDGGPGAFRLSASKPLLEGWVTKYETCRAELGAIRELKPVLPPPEKEGTFLERLGL